MVGGWGPVRSVDLLVSAVAGATWGCGAGAEADGAARGTDGAAEEAAARKADGAYEEDAGGVSGTLCPQSFGFIRSVIGLKERSPPKASPDLVTKVVQKCGLVLCGSIVCESIVS